VAGLHRLLDKRQVLFEAEVIISVAGMEGALTSVVAGLVDCPVIGVPTSVAMGPALVEWRRCWRCSIHARPGGGGEHR